MNDAVEQFIDYLTATERYTEKTITAYRRDMYKWLTLCADKGLKNWQALDKKTIRTFIIQLHQQHITIRSIRRYLSSLRLFFDYLKQQGSSTYNPAMGIQTPKTEKKLLKTLDYHQIEVLIEHIKKSKYAVRNLALFELLYSCALRVSELVSLNINSIDFEAGFIKVLGKGKKERYVPLGSRAAEALKVYLDSRFDDEKALFLSQRSRRLAVRSVQMILEQMSLTSPLGIHIHPHMLRHSAATHFLQSSHDLTLTQDFLGHSSIKSTQVYVHLDFLDLADSYDKSHPLSKKNS